MYFDPGKRSGWHRIAQDSRNVHYTGREASIRSLLSRLPIGRAPTRAEASAALKGLPGHFAVFVSGQGWSLAAVDAVRSFPLFYAEINGVIHISGCARTVREAAGLHAVDKNGLLEFIMAGFVTGDGTVIDKLHQLQAGEALRWSAGKGCDTFRYYRFHSFDFYDEPANELIERLTSATNFIFERLEKDLDGRTAVIPLSAGLDSRLVAAKLVERGYPHIQTFSYGVPGNHEARHARSVAERLGLPWLFIPIAGGEMRAFHHSAERRKFWAFSDGLTSVPNPQDIVPLLKIRKTGWLPEDAVLINGQSGDFSCGAHIPKALTEPGASLETLCQFIISKHFSFWKDLHTPDRLSRVKKKLALILSSIDEAPQDPVRLAALHDCWEWQERQAKYVVNGQRIYDYLHLDWRLPLWEAEWNDFWPRVPIQLRLGRQLHHQFLKSWNYKGLFSGPEPVVFHWPGARIILFAGAQLAGLLGPQVKNGWYRYARWFGHYGYQWRIYPFLRFLKDTHQARHVLSLNAEEWIAENLGIQVREWV